MTDLSDRRFLELVVKSSGPTRIVRLKNLIIHPLQRPISREAVNQAFENWGANIDPDANVLHVMALDDERLPGDEKEVIEAPEGAKFYILDGQHRVQVLRKAIEHDIVLERQNSERSTEVTAEEVEAHPRACWPAKIHYRGECRSEFDLLAGTDALGVYEELETEGGAGFSAWLQQYNREFERHNVKYSETWLVAHRIWEEENFGDALRHLTNMIPHSTDRRALKKVLRHTRLRPCVKALCDIPALAPLLDTKYIWAMLQRQGTMVASATSQLPTLPC